MRSHRRVRRPLTDDEFARLIRAAEAGDEFRGLSGPDRAVLYVTAGYTGLRASELASLTPASFQFDAATPSLIVAPGTRSGSGRTRFPFTRTSPANFARGWPGDPPPPRCGRGSGPSTTRPWTSCAAT